MNYQKFLLGRDLITHKNKRIVVVITLSFAIVITGVVLAVLAFVGNNSVNPNTTSAVDRDWESKKRKYNVSYMKDYLEFLRKQYPQEQNSQIIYSLEVLWNNSNYGGSGEFDETQQRQLSDPVPGFLFVVKNGNAYRYYHGVGKWVDRNKKVITPERVFLCKEEGRFNEEDLPWQYMRSIYNKDISVCSVYANNPFFRQSEVANKYINVGLSENTITLNPGHYVDIRATISNTTSNVRLFVYDKSGNVIILRYDYGAYEGDFYTHNDHINKTSKMSGYFVLVNGFGDTYPIPP